MRFSIALAALTIAACSSNITDAAATTDERPCGAFHERRGEECYGCGAYAIEGCAGFGLQCPADFDPNAAAPTNMECASVPDAGAPGVYCCDAL